MDAGNVVTVRMHLLALGSVVLVGCPADFLDLGSDYQAVTTGNTTTTASVSTTSVTLPLCTPGDERPCYTGPEGTKGEGTCKAGTETCNAEGTAFGPCEGEILPAAENCLTPKLDEDCDGSFECIEALWSRRAGDGQAQSARDVAIDPLDGSVVVIGTFQGAIDFGDFLVSKGNRDAFVVRFDVNGNHLWSKQFGGSDIDIGSVVALDKDRNVILAGTFKGMFDAAGATLSSPQTSAFVMKRQSDGSHVWSRKIDASGPIDIKEVAADSAGGVFIAGDFNGSLDFGGGNTLVSAGAIDVFVAKLDANGGHVWSRRFGDGTDEQRVYGMNIDSEGSPTLTGYFYGSVDFGGGPLQSAGGSDAFVARLTPNGDHLWSRRFGDSADQRGVRVAETPNGPAVVGNFSGSVDFDGNLLSSAGGSDWFVTQLDHNGAHLWSRGYGNAGGQSLPIMATDGAGNLLFAAVLEGQVNFDGIALSADQKPRVCLVKLDSQGVTVSGQSYDVPAGYPSSIAATPGGYALIVGGFSGTADFGSGLLMGTGGDDAFVAKLKP